MQSLNHDRPQLLLCGFFPLLDLTTCLHLSPMWVEASPHSINWNFRKENY